MTITKKKFTQTILIGLLFAFTLGVLSFIIHPNFIPVPKVTESQTIIIEKITNNKIQKYLNNLNQVNYNNKIISLTNELYKSIKYIQTKYSKDEKLHPQCTTFSMNLTDNSIFIKTDSYIAEDKKNFENCLENIFYLSFERFKNKFTFENFEDLSQPNLNLSNENQIVTLDNNKSFLKQSEKNCADLEISYNEIINKFLFALESDNELNNNKIDNSKSFINMLDLNQKLITIMNLRSEYCTNKFRDDDLYLRTKYITNLKKFNSAIENSNLYSVFTIEKITKSHSIETNQYLSLKNIVITFSLFGFIFGVLLFSNFEISKNKNE